ncbi:MAG: DUF4129 domain-containing protein [Sphingobacteriales bacterium]|nr:MAG: DUF4129 domain-containing protein [Sphingobacteriales bacterium]
MGKRKQLLFFGLFWVVLAGIPEGYTYAQGTVVERAPADEADYVDPEVVVPDEDYNYDEEDEEVSGPFYSGFSFNDTLDKKDFDKKAIRESDWNEISRNPEFQYEKETEKVKKPEQDTGSNWFRKFIEWLIQALSVFLVSGFGKIILWGIVALILCWLIFLIFKRRGIHLFARSGKKIKKIDTADETGDDFIPESWQSVIQQAEANGNYRLAVRHSFRHIVHLMQEAKIISSERALANHQILSLLRQSNYHADFRQLLRHYEYIWYGDFAVQEQGYQRIKSIYTKLSSQL